MIRKQISVLDSEMSYVESGSGDPIVFLHGNPTSSYVWRNVIPHLAGHGRCLAPDMIGMGQSGKSPASAYRFVDHAAYLDAWFDALELTKNVTLVLHDWGGALGLHRATRFPEQIKAIAYMEAVATTMRWNDFGEFAPVFQALRSAKGDEMVLDGNFFVEVILPGNVMRTLSADEMAAYRAPFTERESRLPTLVWPREIPIEGEPPDVSAIVERSAEMMLKSPIPKLLIVGEPGAIIRNRVLEFCRQFPNQKEVTVKGRHFLQEDSADQIGAALRDFAESLD